MRRRPFFWKDTLAAGLIAGIASGVPSTLYAVLAGGDPWQAARAAGAVLVGAGCPTPGLFLAAGIVHFAVSLFWAALLTAALPPRRRVLWATAAAAGIGVLDLRLIAGAFPEIRALEFWPQMADHLVWGAVVGLVLRRRGAPPAPAR